MEFSIAELVAIGAIILNVIVYFSRVPTRKDLSDLRIELRNEIGGLRSEIGGLRNEIGDVRNELRNELRNEIRDVRNEVRNEIIELRHEMNVRFSKLDESFTNHLMFMHGDARQPPTQGEDK